MAGYDLSGRRVWVAGQRGMVGSAIIRRLASEDCTILTEPNRIDLRDQLLTQQWFEQAKPDAVFLAAAKVGGIYANSSRPAEFIYDNLMIQANVVEAARKFGVAKLMALGSSCIYPKFAPQPIREEALLSGPLEETNEAYAVAKIAGIKLCTFYRQQYGCDFISAMPTNLYGPGDNFDLEQSHVIPALIRKAHEAKIQKAPHLRVWGTGSPKREFMHVDDLADACIFLMKNYSDKEHINVGTGEDVSIKTLAELICRTVDLKSPLQFDSDKPDGTPRKLLDVSRLHGLGWRHQIDLETGLKSTYNWFCTNHATARLS